MKTFLNILLIALALVVVIKFSPALFALAMLGLVAAAVLGAVGLSLLTALAAIVVSIAFALAPVWVPVLIVVAIVSLFRRERNVPPALPA